jgi:1,4-alpha-glucan branching enzyme
MPDSFPLTRISFTLTLLLAATLPLCAASNDNRVEWAGVFSSSTWRSPEHPGSGESFTVELRVYRGDITGAKVRTWDGETRRFDMVWVRNDGVYDIWRARVDGTEEDSLYYRFEITDGDDVDYYNSLGMTGGAPSSGDFVINTTSLGPFPLGATIDGGTTVFRVWAPNADEVFVAGSFNGWNASSRPMTKVAGVWQTRVPSVGHGARYKYVIENGGERLWRTDPRARRQTNSVGDSVVWRSDYDWGDDDWVTPYFEDMIIYELHVGTFSGGGDGVTHYPGHFRDVVDRHLDHLLELGINVIELMPIGEFAGEMSWGYNPSFQFAPESSYGSPDDLKYLVDRCHQSGIAVILDVVFNHMGGSDLAGNLLDYDGEEIYFYPEGNGYRETPWGPRLDYGRTQVRQYIRDTIRSWLEEYHVDGFRVDGTDFIKVNAEGWSVLKEIVQTTDTISRKAIVIGEQLPNDPAVTVSIDAGGAGMDSQWNDAFHDNLRNAIGAAAFGDPNMGALAQGMNHFDFGGTKAVNYIESHDESAVNGRVTEAADGNDPHSVYAYGRGKMSYGLVMFTAGIPMILHGQEFMEDRRFGDSRGHRIQWSYKDEYRDYFRACRDMTRLRSAIPSLRSDGYQNVFHVNESGNVVAWHRWTSSGDDVVIVASLNNSDFNEYCLGMPLPGEWREIFNSDAGAYGGRNRGNGGRIDANGGGRDGLPHSACIVLPRMGLLVFARRSVDVQLPGFLRGDCNGDGRIDISDAVRHLLELFGGAPGGDCPDACDANGDDRGDVSDALYVLNYLFVRPLFGPPPSPPPGPWPSCREFVPRRDCDRECVE